MAKRYASGRSAPGRKSRANDMTWMPQQRQSITMAGAYILGCRGARNDVMPQTNTRPSARKMLMMLSVRVLYSALESSMTSPLACRIPIGTATRTHIRQ